VGRRRKRGPAAALEGRELGCVTTLYTVGHGARSAAELVAILKEVGVETLVDVRAYPGSRRHPQFSKENLRKSMEHAGIAYEWHGKALGGMRASFADHMETEEFQRAAAALAARQDRVCILCAESDPEHCHRSFIADWLVARGTRVIHLLDLGEQREHPFRLI
jgi:uncharacterized protein (DUF488 family)